jgi:Ca-activated chloride channel family protein
LLTQERPNIFAQKVANIEPGKRIDIELLYYNALPYRDGAYVFAFPTVVGPRFNPAGSTDGVGAVARGDRGTSGQSTEVSYLAPSERSGHDLSLVVELDAGVSLEKVESSTHPISVQNVGTTQRRISLREQATLPNKDFVLRYWVAGRKVKTALMRHEDQRGGYFTLMLQPPEDLKAIPRTAREMIFVLDCSGSMNGKPLDKAKAAVRRVLELMVSDDTFQIIRFSNNASQLGPRPLRATPRNIRRGLRYLDSLNGSGGTMMIEGIKAALDYPHEQGKLRVISFMTDGYIGNEAEILGAIHDKIGDSRLFSFGIGSSVNRFLLNRMALVGRGAVAYVEQNDAAANEAVDAFYESIAYPALSDVSIDWNGLEVTDVFPSRLPDLHVGRPVVLTGRYRGEPPGSVRVKGRAGGRRVTYDVELRPEARSKRNAIAQIWARMRIADLANRAMVEADLETLTRQIKETALGYGLMSAFTAFVAVDSSRRTEGGPDTPVDVPVPVPEGVSYDTTVPSGG